jgi:pectin methylesterase-like acyl-CoA thioesterase
MKRRLAIFFLSTALFRPLPAQSMPPVCQVVTADQVGSDGMNTAAIQQQLDLCGVGASAPTAVELSPAKGTSFASGALYIPSNVVLWLDAGVTLNASTNPGDFQRTANSRTLACDSTGPIAIPVCGSLDANNTGCVALINSCKTSNAGVGGQGVIEGHGWSALTGGPNTGTTWWALAGAAKAGNYAQSLNAPKMISFQQSSGITLSFFAIHNAPLVHILLGKDAGAKVNQVTIVTPTPDHTISSFPYNSDGMDISGSSNVTVDGVDFSDGDDNIALEGGGSGPVSNITVTNSTFRAGHGLSIGSPTSRGVTNVSASNIKFIGTDNGLRIKTDAANGGLVDQIKYGTICMSGVSNPIVIDPYYSSSTGNLIPMFKNVEIDGMWADVGSVTFTGYAGQPPLALTLNNVRIETLGKVTTANANIAEISDPAFPFPIAIPSTPGVTVTQSQAPAAPPVDIKSYCQAALGLGSSGGSTPTGPTVIDDTFADGNSQNQDLANNSLRLFNGRTNNIRTDQVGSVTFDVTPAGTSSDAFWAFFTNAGSPVVLGVGDKLAVAVTFSLSGFKNNAQDVRWGVLDSLGTRNTNNLNGGMNDATFINDTGYGLQFFASGTGSPFVIARRTVLSSANVFNSFGDFAPISGTGATARQALIDDTSYTLAYTIERLTATDTRISTAVTGGTLSDLNYSAVESTATPNTSFDYFAFRIGGTNFASKITFTELKVQYSPAAPVITSQPQPSSLTVRVGSNVTLAVGASGNQLAYQWQKDGQPISGNPSSTTPTLILTNVQHSDAGSYVAVVTNAGGSAASNAVPLKVTDGLVGPPPSITTQPSNITVTMGNSTNLAVQAAGDGLVYQWFKNGAIISGATASQLTIPNAQVGDSASYYVVISNSSGSITSSSATLLVVSAMSAIGFRPWNQQTGICTDTPLYIAFDQPAAVGKSGRVRVFNSRGTLMDTIDLAANPQTRVIGGAPFVYYPVIVTGNIAAIYLHQTLPYNDTYSVTMEPGVVVDANGAPFVGFPGPNFWTFTTQMNSPAAGAAALTVAFDGGDFCTVQGAVDFVPANNTQPVAITVHLGTFTGITYVPSNKPFITVRGEDRAASVLQYPNNNNINPSVSSRAAFGVDASDFTLENITLINTTPHGGSQAEAFRGNNKRILLNRVNLYSFQDTLMLQGTGYVTNSYIEGDVDFMWGSGAVYFQNCELKAVTSGGYYTQIRNGQGQNGNVYVSCRLTSAPGVSGMYLGRIDPTVFPYSQVVYINCAMGPQIAPVGWLLNNATSAPNVQFWEYHSTDLNGAPVDVSQRLRDSLQISADQAAQWSDPAFVLGGWVPFTVNATPMAGTSIIVDWSAAAGHSGQDWIGLCAVGAPDAGCLSKLNTGGATTGHLTFAAPMVPGQYEFRYFMSDGTRATKSNRVTVR